MRNRIALVLFAVAVACGGEMNSSAEKTVNNRITTDEHGNIHMNVCDEAVGPGFAGFALHPEHPGALAP